MSHLILFLCLVVASASYGARFLDGKVYPYAVGAVPADLDDAGKLKWLEAQPKPRLSRPAPKLEAALRAHLKLGAKDTIQTAVLGSPRVTGTGTPKFYVWVFVRRKAEGAARLALADENETSDVRVLDFVPKADAVRDPKALEKKFPVDAILMIRKMTK